MNTTARTLPEASLWDAAITSHGLRMTDQRRRVYEVLLARRDHPTAVEVFLRAKESIPSISLATIYNCLEALTGCGLVKHVTCEKGPARFCPNLHEHAHFFCEGCGIVLDVPRRVNRGSATGWNLPDGAVVIHEEATFKGFCPKCAGKQVPGSTRTMLLHDGAVSPHAARQKRK
jgi:Fur family peroxide stress response transcriptional regulator